MNEFCLKTNSPTFRKALDFCDKVADSDANILLIGESGTGKEVAARYIHKMSKRRNNNFVAVNCSAFSQTLLESELFGHEQGSFTGATKSREGKLESASGGTLFLDEIGETIPTTQIKLLRVIESKQVERIGSNVSRYIDFRLLSATNADLNSAIRSGEFREDFFYRISTIVIRIPPLRKRLEDLSSLISFFMEKAQAENRKTITHMIPEVRKFLYEYDYPGNVRELKNMIDRMVILSENGVVAADCLPILYSMGKAKDMQITLPCENPVISEPPTPNFNRILPYRDYKKQTEASYLQWVLQQTNGNVTEAAKLLQMSQRQLYNKIQEYGLKK